MRMTNRPSRRLTSLLLACCLVLGLLPAAGAAPAAAGPSWADPYLEKLVSWGVMRGDQEGNLDPDRDITRAEYVSMINRAYGYTEAAPTPFTDVSPAAWYAEDIGIAYKAGYFTGTATATAAPEDTLTREQATVILGRNLMLQEGPGESLDFSDSRDLSSWSRGLVKTAAEYGVVKGLPDGTFQPQRNITRGEVASLLVNAVGTPVNAPGEYSLGSVYGNVTVSASGVTLRDTIIAGDLYLTGGVGLGYVTLQNVTVLGKIVASGAGEANKGDSSIILRNVSSQEMVVDSPANQYVTIRAEGDTEIERTSVRTPSYLEDVTGGGLGLKYIELDGEPGTALELSGNIKEVVNLTPGSALNLALGSAQTLTVDEKAAGSRLNIASGADVKNLNLDTGASVTGDGDVGIINVNANGSTTTMLPDNIVIRPGVNANISGQNMDSGIGAESSQDPKLLSGYPRAADVAPTSASAVFSTNKSGTVYWAVSSITDGSVAESDLISPPSYGSKILRSGSVKAAASSTELVSKITGLTSDGSYYLSAVLVDSRDQRSPVKVIAFTTPDDSVPNFASGYPVMTKITDTAAQVTVMTTKSCKLYYALLPKGSAAPKADDFKANAVTGNLGFGMVDVVKNTTRPVDVNDKLLEELETYDLYLWLNDADNSKSSAVKKLTFTTVDRTPPKYNTPPTVNSVKETSVGLYVNLNEAATFYWAVVKTGTEYPKPLAGSSVKPELTGETAKLQVMAGMNAIKSGRVTCSEAKDATFNVTGLEAETAYDLYYVAQDRAGNYSASVEKITIHTLDNKAPTVEQKFTRFNSSDSTNPLSDTDVQLIFSEGIRDNRTNDVFLDLYKTSQDDTKPQNERNAARDTLTQRLRENIQLWTYGANGLPVQVQERTAANESQPGLNWIIDYRYAVVEQKDGESAVTVRFPTNSTDKTRSALNLRSGGTYYFLVDGIADTSDNKNIMPVTTLPEFTTVFAQVNLAATSVEWLSKYRSIKPDGTFETVTLPEDGRLKMDTSFQLIPVSTGNVEDSVNWDMLVWCDTSAKYQLFYREKTSTSDTAEVWTLLGESGIMISTNSESPIGLSMMRDFNFLTQNGSSALGKLNALDEDHAYEFAVHFTEIDGLSERTSWTQRITMNVSVAAGSGSALNNLSGTIILPSKWTTAQTGTDPVASIGVKENFDRIIQFRDEAAPKFIQGYPRFSPGDTVADITVMLDRPATIYYVVAESEIVPPLDLDGNRIPWDSIPKAATKEDGGSIDELPHAPLSSPSQLDITSPKYGSVGVQSGYLSYSAGATPIRITGLTAKQQYHVYFVLQGASQYSQVKCYGFETGDVTAPKIELRNSSPSVGVTTSQDSVLDYILVNDIQVPNISYLNDKLSDHTAPDKTLNSAYAGYTVLRAMMMEDADGYSLFDNYANDTVKQELAAIFRSSSTFGGYEIAKQGTLNLVSDRGESVNCEDNMSSSATYVFLAVAHHAQGTVDTFKAITNIYKPDTVPPGLANLGGGPDLSGWSEENALTSTYSGSISITFTKEIYQRTNEVDPNTGLRIPKPVYCCYNSLIPTEDGKKVGVSIMDVLGGTAANKVTPVTSLTPTRTITLTYTGIRHGDTIEFYRSGTICNANGISTDQILTLTFDAVNKDNLTGGTIPKFVDTWSAAN